jgi:DNA-binding transcriptional MerR regulator/effector-binding domain-containing protein
MRFSIGEFSRMTSLSIKSLRLYHEKELLFPAEVDEFTNYRYYSEANFELARAIRMLRNLDFSLAEIRDILDECEEEADLLVYLQQKIKEIAMKIDRYKSISHSMEIMIQTERENAMKDNVSFEIEERELPTLLIAGHRMTGRYDEVGKGFGLLYKKLGRHTNGKPLTLYYDGEYKENQADFEPCVPIRQGTDTEGISVRELKGGKAVTLMHKGSYDTLGESYKKVIAHIHEKGYKSQLPHREVYIKGPGMILRGNPKNYLTEIQMLIGK